MLSKPKMSDACYGCIHRRPLPGSAHSRCAKGVELAGGSAAVAELFGLFGAGLDGLAAKHGVVGTDHAKLRGWFAWPFNFDPVWLEACALYESREQALMAPVASVEPLE